MASLGHYIETNLIPRISRQNTPVTVINAILPKMGFHRHMPRAVIFGPQTYGGTALEDAKVEQAVSLITDMITDLQQSTLVGKQFTFLIANYQRYLGSSSPSSEPSQLPVQTGWKKIYTNQIIASSNSW